MDSARIPSPDSSSASALHDARSSNTASPAVSLAASQGPPMDGATSERADSDVLRPPPENAEETERHPKGRRKRTAAKDKAILEAAYNADPKPDKTARLEIVKRVTLNEKEVQIWFQNRRQNDRRRSRPLSPQEIAALRYGGMQILSADGGSFGQHSTAGDIAAAAHPPHGASTTPFASPDLAPWLPGRHPFHSEAPPPPPPRSPTNQSPNPYAAMGAQTPAQQQQQHPNHSDLLNSSSRSFPGSASASFMANRWHPGSSFSTPPSSFRRVSCADDSFKFEPFAPSSCSSTVSAPILPPPHSRSNSQVRLSLSLEGKASLVSGLRSPSPPRSSSSHSLYNPQTEPIPISIPSIRRESLHRSPSSHSITLPPISTLTDSLCGESNGSSTGVGAAAAAPAPLPPRLTRGRSRDVHAWEFAADSAEDREDELTQQARHEASGSAIAAISLLRTTSASAAAAAATCASPPVLQPNGSKRNASVRPSSGFDRTGPNGQQYPFKRAKLGRSSSGVARLQSSSSRLNVERLVDPADGEEKSTDGGDGKKMDVATLISTSGHDSDKENWSPDEDGSPAVSRSQSAAPAGIVGGRILPPVLFSASPPRRHLPAPSLHGGSGRRTGFADERRGMLSGAYRAYSAPGQRSNKRRAGRNPASISIFEDDGEEVDSDGDSSGKGRFGPRRDDDVELFMRGEVSPSKKGDFDCVAGLLSLSQGNWR